MLDLRDIRLQVGEIVGRHRQASIGAGGGRSHHHFSCSLSLTRVGWPSRPTGSSTSLTLCAISSAALAFPEMSRNHAFTPAPPSVSLLKTMASSTSTLFARK